LKLDESRSAKLEARSSKLKAQFSGIRFFRFFSFSTESAFAGLLTREVLVGCQQPTPHINFLMVVGLETHNRE
jgi:hypothetical protein